MINVMHFFSTKIVFDIYTSQLKKRYKGLLFNIFTQRKKIDTNRIIQIHMDIANKAISTKFLNIITRTKHGQTESFMQYGCLRISVTCMTTSCSNDSFASPTHRTNQSLDKGLWDVVPLVHKCVTQLLQCFRWVLTVEDWLCHRTPSSGSRFTQSDPKFGRLLDQVFYGQCPQPLLYYSGLQLRGLSFVLPVCCRRVISLEMVILDTLKWSATEW